MHNDCDLAIYISSAEDGLILAQTVNPYDHQGSDSSVEVKLNIGEEIKIHDLYCGIRNKQILLAHVTESKKLQKLEKFLLTCKQLSLKDLQQLICIYSSFNM
jgi:hypothetical protein